MIQMFSLLYIKLREICKSIRQESFSMKHVTILILYYASLFTSIYFCPFLRARNRSLAASILLSTFSENAGVSALLFIDNSVFSSSGSLTEDADPPLHSKDYKRPINLLNPYKKKKARTRLD